jgi:hypothetical protein
VLNMTENFSLHGLVSGKHLGASVPRSAES